MVKLNWTKLTMVKYVLQVFKFYLSILFKLLFMERRFLTYFIHKFYFEFFFSNGNLMKQRNQEKSTKSNFSIN
jgi:Sec7-like guanine-nucleotide exchange factor